MSKVTRSKLKTYFQTGDQPTENEFIDVFDSTLNLSEDNAITGSVIISGSDVSLLVHGDITAKNYIVSSSITNITTQTLSGSTEFGNSADDTHDFTGHITASGDISASGDILGTDLILMGNEERVNGSFLKVDGSGQILYQTSQTYFQQHIKLPSNKTLILGTNDAYKIYSNSSNQFLLTSGSVYSQSTILQYTPSNKTFTFGADEITTNGNIKAPQGYLSSANITSSGNISGSAVGTVSAGSGSFHYLKGNSTAATGLEITGYISATNVTSSGNISSSGAITSNTLNVNGSQVDFTGLPTSDPGIVGRLYRTGADIKISI